MIDRYIKILRYLLITKKIITVQFKKLFIKKIIFKYEILKNIVINRKFIFINTF